MKKLLVIGIGLAVALCASTAMANDNQMSGSFQTLGSVVAEDMTLTAMTGDQLNSIEGKRFNGDLGRYIVRYVGSRTNQNHSNVTNNNSCYFCGNGNGGFNGLFGGIPNSGVIQGNGNTTQQVIP